MGKLALFLLLGAVLNVAVAWVCAAFVDPNGVDMQVTFDVSFVKGEPNRRIGVQERFGHTRFNRQIGDAEYAFALTTVASDDRRSEDHCGWPCRALMCFNYGDVRFDYSEYNRRYAYPRLNRIAHGILLSPWTTGRHATRVKPGVYKLQQIDNVWRALPYDVIWPGFAINTIFYAAILWLPFAALGAFRRRRRIKRGLCPKCAYDLRGSTSQTCPECGKAVRSADSRRPIAESLSQ